MSDVQNGRFGFAKKIKQRRDKFDSAVKRIRAKSGLKNNNEILIKKTSKHIYVTIFSVQDGRQVFSMSTLNLGKNIYANVKSAEKLGKVFAEECKKRGIDALYVNRGSAKYHGIVASLINSIRSVGFKI